MGYDEVASRIKELAREHDMARPWYLAWYLNRRRSFREISENIESTVSAVFLNNVALQQCQLSLPAYKTGGHFVVASSDVDIGLVS